jgi:cytochrome P450
VYFAWLRDTYGDLAMARIGPRRICVVSEPELVREVLVNQQRIVTKTRALRRAALLLGNGLLTSEGDEWRQQRRLVQPAFHRERIAGYAGTMVAFAERRRDAWRDGAAIDAHAEMMSLTLAIAGETLFGAHVEHEAADIAAALETAMAMFRRLTMPFSELLDRLPLPANRRFAAARARLDATVRRMIAERRASGVDRGDVLSMLLLAQDESDDTGMTDEQVRDEVLTLFLAGHETTASALAWTWYLLARNPATERALHHEIDTVLGDRTPTAADLERLPFTRAVLAESMRLYPPAWTLGRETHAPVTLGGYEIPVGTMIFMSQWLMHRDARWFPEPLAFRPERWTPEFESTLPRMAYFPFGAGPRKCIGESFAWMEGVLVIATLARRWRVRVPAGVDPTPRALITLRPSGGVPAILERR